MIYTVQDSFCMEIADDHIRLTEETARVFQIPDEDILRFDRVKSIAKRRRYRRNDGSTHTVEKAAYPCEHIGFTRHDEEGASDQKMGLEPSIL